jgi:hypothetical protein
MAGLEWGCARALLSMNGELAADRVPTHVIKLYHDKRSRRGMSAPFFSRDGGRVMIASEDSTVRVYLLGIEDLVEFGSSHLMRGRTPEECQKYLPAAKCPE